jgi:ferritin
MLSDKMHNALNAQLNHEFYSSYLYLGMSTWLEDQSLRGFASWFRVQAQEELAHAMIVHNYILDRGSSVVLEDVKARTVDYQALRSVFELALSHEREVTSNFNSIAALAADERDFATVNFTQYFVDEQVEEEASFRDLIDQLKLVGDTGHAIFMMDKELGSRRFVPPPQLSAQFRPSPMSTA